MPREAELVGAAMAGFFAVATVGVLLQPGDSLSPLLVAGWLAALFVGVLLFPLGDRLFGGRGAQEVVARDGVTRIRHMPHEVPALVVVCLVGVTSGAGVVAVMIDVGFPQGAVAGGLLAAYFFYYPLLVALRRVRRGWLDLSPTTVTLRGWGFTAAVRWDDVVGVDARVGVPAVGLRVRDLSDVDVVRHVRWGRIDWPVSRRAPRGPRPGGARAVSRTGLVIPLDRFAIDPSLVYCLLHTYQLRPHLRVELGTRAATERAAALRLVDAAGTETHPSTGG